jgi:hypothetical protein
MQNENAKVYALTENDNRGYVQTLITPLEERLTAIPGVVAARIVDQPPVLGYGSGTNHATSWPASRSAGSREKLGKQNGDARVLCSDWRAHCAGPPFFVAGHSFVAAE